MSKRVVGRSPKLIQNVFVLLLLSLFAILSTFLVTVGAQLYRNTVENAERNNATRIVSTVVRSSIWAEDGGVGDIMIETLPFEGKNYKVLSIIRKYGKTDDDLWVKRLFVYEGNLRETYTLYYKKVPLDGIPGDTDVEDLEEGQYTLEVNDFHPEYGEPMCELYRFEPTLDGNLLTVQLETTDHLTSTVQVYMRTGGAAQ